jgi:type I restriction enzyme S subunit
MTSSPLSWVTLTLGDICEIERGVTFPSGAQASEPSEKHIACLRTTNIQEQVNWEDLIYIPHSYARDENKKVRKNDILISIANSKDLVGKVAFVDEVEVEAVFGGFISIIRTTEFVDPYYLYSFLRATFTQEKLRSVSNQTTNIANLTAKEINRLPIPLPPLQEQRRVANILRQANIIRQDRVLADEKVEYLALSLFNSYFGDPIANNLNWETSPLSDVVAKDCPITYGIVQPGNDFEDGILLVRPVDLGKRHIEKSNLKKIDPKIAKQYSRTKLNGNEILLSVRGQIGEISLSDFELNGANVTRGIAPLWFSEPFLHEYMYGFFKYPAVKEWQLREAKGMALKQLNIEDLRSMPVPIPSLKLRKKYADALKELWKLEDRVSDFSVVLEKLFTSLEIQAFTGELTASWREKHKDELQRSAVERDKALRLIGEKARLIDFEEGRVTPEELEGIRKALGNFAVNLASYHIEMPNEMVRSFEEITKPLTHDLVSMRQNVITPFLESFRQSLQNIQFAPPVPPDEDEINRQIDLLPLPQEKRAIHDVLDATSLRVLKLAHASPAYFTPDDLTFGAITSTHASASLRVLDSLGFVRLVEIDGVLRYHVIDANTDAALKPNQLQQ